MEQIVCKYYNPKLNIAMQDWRSVYLINDKVIRLLPEMYKGNLVYRIAGKSKRYSYAEIKKHLVIKTSIINLPQPPF